ncbi:8-oxo-dGTP diphosphatase [Caldalkalibacillus uzonensis]|uniref:8-oxo-dGTP diphosphatase n=1 Tax=Caldalkalibacillus uzonensis TaxID=353224 RepID=A0ABU0CPZ7_9BACI|nr:8-oxo-dGTP diphosphatase [Caldalkalibacillus uzonensis]MDQ0338484.1 8-oxo-dGTP diphosphatase [Caldalkalibacillus uzonensis]
MQRVTNCILIDREQDEVLLLQKPRRGWWVAPGGKMESGETIREAVTREFKEETGITLIDPALKGVFTILIEENGQHVDEWMMFTFVCDRYEGEVLAHSPEGQLAWLPRRQVAGLPKAKGDQIYFEHILEQEGDELLILKFRYTPDYDLISYE